MDPSRRRFLIRGAQASGALTVGGLVAATAADTPEPTYEAVPVYAAYLRGVQYRDLPAGFLAELAPGEAVTLLREPDNRHDERAVAARVRDVHCGYLPREDNVVLSRLLDAGLPLACAASVIAPEAPPWHQLAVTVSLLYPAGHAAAAVPKPAELTDDRELQRALAASARAGVWP